jgi:hypothetical protein
MRFCRAGGLALILASFGWALSARADVSVNWLGNTPPSVSSGVSWGVPWVRGTVAKDQTFAIKTADGKTLPLQAWPLAYWPDGSIKWTGFATVGGPDITGPLTIVPGPAAAPAGDVVTVNQTADAIDIDTGKLKCHISKSGSNFIDSLSVGGTEVARNGHLECISKTGRRRMRSIRRAGAVYQRVTSVTVEQSGPVRAVVKFEGVHQSPAGDRQWLPFVVRLYFYAGRSAGAAGTHDRL